MEVRRAVVRASRAQLGSADAARPDARQLRVHVRPSLWPHWHRAHPLVDGDHAVGRQSGHGRTGDRAVLLDSSAVGAMEESRARGAARATVRRRGSRIRAEPGESVQHLRLVVAQREPGGQPRARRRSSRSARTDSARSPVSCSSTICRSIAAATRRASSRRPTG